MSTPRAPRRGRWVGAGAAIGAAGLVGIVGLGGASAELHEARERAAPQLAAIVVEAAPARFDTAHRRWRDFIGRVEPGRSAALGFEVDGRLLSVLVDAGERVVAGQPLARLDVARLEARRGELEADLERARARLELGRITKERLSRLIGEGAASQQSLDDAREGLRALAAAVRVAEARLDANAVELEKSELRAPFDAVVIARHRDEGSVVSGGEAVLEVLEQAAPEARVGIAGPQVEHLERGDRLEVEVHGQPISAVVRAVLPVRGLGTRTVDMLLDLQASPGTVRSGDLVRVRLADDVPGAGLWVPIEALAEGRRGLWSVTVAEPLAAVANDAPGAATHRLSRRTVEVVHMDVGRAFVRGPVSDGEQVLTSGAHRVVPGQRVRLAGVRHDG